MKQKTKEGTERRDAQIDTECTLYLFSTASASAKIILIIN